MKKRKSLRLRIKFAPAARMMKRIRKNPPTGADPVAYPYKRISNDCLFVVRVKLSTEDITVSWDEEKKIVYAWVTSKFEARQEMERKREEENRLWEEENFRLFKEWLTVKKELNMPDNWIWQVVKGYMAYASLGNQLFREYLGSGYRHSQGYKLDFVEETK